MEILIIAIILIGIIAAAAYRARKDISKSRGSGGGKPDTNHANQHLK